MKNIFVILLSISIFSCEKKEKTYEELEAEVLSDVLPDITKYELNNSFWLLFPPPPPLPERNLEKIYDSLQVDSIARQIDIEWDEYRKNQKEAIKIALIEIDKFKKYEQSVIDTLRFVEKLKIETNVYMFDSLDNRGIKHSDFLKCNLKIKTVSSSETFEGKDRETHKPVLFPTRVLITPDKQNSFFSILKWYGTYHVFCKYSEKMDKWEIDKIVKDDELKN
ncbi:hypothetical protein [Flavobacterium sp. U410]|jgi:vacuolar-type H+-ATPase subunit I/STV1